MFLLKARHEKILQISEIEVLLFSSVAVKFADHHTTSYGTTIQRICAFIGNQSFSLMTKGAKYKINLTFLSGKSPGKDF